MSKLPFPAVSPIVEPVESPSGHETPVFENKIWSVEDVARELKLSRSHVYKLISEDKIPFAKVGRLVRFYPERVYEWLSKGGTR